MDRSRFGVRIIGLLAITTLRTSRIRWCELRPVRARALQRNGNGGMYTPVDLVVPGLGILSRKLLGVRFLYGLPFVIRGWYGKSHPALAVPVPVR